MSMPDGAITSIRLNEACSSGCGSFLDDFTLLLDLDIFAFAEWALFALISGRDVAGSWARAADRPEPVARGRAAAAARTIAS
jgi:hypothetical protein